MSRTAMNSAPCHCCGRLMPRKAGKQRFCRAICRKATTNCDTRRASAQTVGKPKSVNVDLLATIEQRAAQSGSFRSARA